MLGGEHVSDAPIHLLRGIARRFAQIQRRTWSCCTPATETQCLILTELHQASGLSIRELAARIGSDPPWVSRVVENLRSQGWVQRHPDPQDRRQVQVWLTPVGQREAAQLQAALNQQAEDLLSQLPLKKRAAALEALGWIAEALEAEYVGGYTRSTGHLTVRLDSGAGHADGGTDL